MNWMQKTLRFLRITDESNNLSLTNILVMSLGVKLLLAATIDPIVLTGFIMSLLQYGYKRTVLLQADRKPDEALDYAKQEMTLLSDAVKADLLANKDMLSSHEDAIEKLKISAGFKKIS